MLAYEISHFCLETWGLGKMCGVFKIFCIALKICMLSSSVRSGWPYSSLRC